jgi:hypothetical protein
MPATGLIADGESAGDQAGHFSIYIGHLVDLACLVIGNAFINLLTIFEMPRLADTIVGAAVGVAAAWAGTRVIRPRLPSGKPTG